MKKLMLLAVLLPSCSTLEKLEELEVPITAAAEIAAQVSTILLNADLNGDGIIQGSSEWLAFVTGVYDAVQDFTEASELDDAGASGPPRLLIPGASTTVL
jgi:hypothetical protein